MRLRLSLSFALVVLVTVASILVIARRNTATELRAFMVRGGMAGVEELVTALEAYYSRAGSWQGVEGLLVSPGHRMGGGQGRGPGMMVDQRLRVADAGGTIIVDSQDPQSGGQLSVDERRQAIPLKFESATVGYLLPEGGVSFSSGAEQELLDRLDRAVLTAGLIAGLAALLLAPLLAHSLLRPVGELTSAAAQMARGNLSQRVRARGDDELAELGRAFNRMAASLQEIEAGRRAMTADISHELRTPLAVQRAHLEALQDGIYPLTAENLEPILSQNLLLSRLVDDLRMLALAESGQLKLELTPSYLPTLVLNVTERFAPQAQARRISLDVETGSSPSLDPLLPVDPQRIEQILSNLLSNALRYTPDGGRIEVKVDCGPRAVRVTVRDSGSGISPEALPRLFERFYRADKSRSRSEGGSGLGLTIARQLAEAHGGSLTAANHPNGGAALTLTLPRQEGSAP